MLRNVFATAALLCALSIPAMADPADYMVEARGKPKGTGSDLIVKVTNKKTTQLVTNAKVWYFSTKQAGKSGPTQTVSKELPSDGKGNYRVRVRLRQQTGDQFEHFMVSVPGEAEPIHARIPVKFDNK
jgi:hypothetical protein